MALLVVWYGQQTLLPTDAGRVVYLPACLFVQTVFKKGIMKDMTLTCLGGILS